MTRVLRVATWNLHEGLPAGDKNGDISPEVRSEIVALIDDHRIDILAVQELDFNQDEKSDILNTIVSRTPLCHSATFPISESSFFPGMKAGIAIASRFPLGNVTESFLPNPRLSVDLHGNTIYSHDKGFLSTSVNFGTASLTVVSVHALPFHVFNRSATEPEFEHVWKELSEELHKLAAGPLIVCGDFNTPRRDLVLDPMRFPMERAIGDRPTFETFAYDDILHSGHLVHRATDVVENFSDHALCIAELEAADR